MPPTRVTESYSNEAAVPILKEGVLIRGDVSVFWADKSLSVNDAKSITLVSEPDEELVRFLVVKNNEDTEEIMVSNYGLTINLGASHLSRSLTITDLLGNKIFAWLA